MKLSSVPEQTTAGYLLTPVQLALLVETVVLAAVMAVVVVVPAAAAAAVVVVPVVAAAAAAVAVVVVVVVVVAVAVAATGNKGKKVCLAGSTFSKYCASWNQGPCANKDGNANVGRQEKYFFKSSYFIKHIFILVTLNVSVFTEISLTPASHPEQNDERQALGMSAKF